MRGCNNTQNGVTIQPNNINLVGNNISLTTIGQTCNGSKVTAALCQSGFCDVTTNTCQSCPTNQTCGNDDGVAGQVCCANGFVCADLGCVMP